VRNAKAMIFLSAAALCIAVLALHACSAPRPAEGPREPAVVTWYESFFCAEGTSCMRTVGLTCILEKTPGGAGSLKFQVKVGSNHPARLGGRCRLALDEGVFDLEVTDARTRRATLPAGELKAAEDGRTQPPGSFEKRMRYTWFLTGTIAIDDAVRDALMRAREARMSVQAGDEAVTIALSRHDLERFAAFVER